MPTEFQPTGHETTVNGKAQPSMAPIYLCESCGFRGAPFGRKRGDEVLSYCGWDGRQPVCVGKNRSPA